MTDYSTDAIEDFIQRRLKDHVLSEGMTRTAQDTSDAYASVGYLRELCSQRDDLLMALELAEAHLAHNMTENVEPRDTIRAAIAKAKGETP